MIAREQMLKIMQESGALDDLDINDEDFLGGHGRERTHVRVMELAYALGLAEEGREIRKLALQLASGLNADDRVRNAGTYESYILGDVQ